MRTLTLFVVAILVALTTPSHAEEAKAIQPEKADTLDPEDIGIAKYVFEASPPARKVMVLRCTHVLAGGKITRASEKIRYTDGKKERMSVLALDPTNFPFNPDQLTPQNSLIKYAGTEITIDKKKIVSQGYVGKVLEFTFANDKDEKESVTFECFVEDYAAAKARIPNLPPEKPGGWGYHAPIEPKKKN